MGCFPCFGGGASAATENKNPRTRTDGDNAAAHGRDDRAQPDTQRVSPQIHATDESNVVNQPAVVGEQGPSTSSSDAMGRTGARSFTLAELHDATEGFKKEYFLGEGGFGKVYKGRIRDTGQVVAIKQLDRDSSQGVREFMVEVYTLCQTDHENLVKLIGWCAEGDQKLLVYEYMPLGSLEDHLYGRVRAKPLSWTTRMKIAAGTARGVEYLHSKMNPPIIYRDLKCSNILLGEGFHPKLSDFGLAKVGPIGGATHVSTRVMGTLGYCAPEYAMTGQLTFKSDIYSFGVVFLELITGRRAIDHSRAGAEKDLVTWAKPFFRDRTKFRQMADPVLHGTHTRSLYQALAIAAMCVQEQPNLRPQIGDIVTALNFLATQKHEVASSSAPDSEKKRSSSKGDEMVVPGSSKSC